MSHLKLELLIYRDGEVVERFPVVDVYEARRHRRLIAADDERVVRMDICSPGAAGTPRVQERWDRTTTQKETT